MKVIIAEDEINAAGRLVSLLKEIDPDLEVMQIFDTVKRIKEWFLSHDPPDLIFLDIQLADGLSFEIFDTVSIRCPVIFTTAYDRYALKAFEVNSIDYLLKPLDKAKLIRSIEKYRNLTQYQTGEKDLESFRNALEMIRGKYYKERFIVKYGEHISSVAVKEICCFFSESKIAFLKTFPGKKYVIDYTLEQIEDFVDPAVFFRINRKYILNIDGISDVIVYSNSRFKVTLKDFPEMDLIVARERAQDFKMWLDR